MMKSKINVLILIMSGFLISCSNTGELPYYNTPDFTPLWLSKDDVSKQNIHKISDFNFTDQDGMQLTKESLNGKIYAANFFFTTCPGICPTMTRNMLKVQEAFSTNENFALVSYSVMPWADSVAALKSYEKTFGIQNGKWHLLTGSTSEIYRLARQSYFAEEVSGYNSDSTEFLHTEHILLVDKQGHLRGVYNGTLPLEIERMTDDIRVLMKED